MYEWYEALPHPPSAKAFWIFALAGKKVMRYRAGRGLRTFGRWAYPVYLSIVAPTVPFDIHRILGSTFSSRAFWFWYAVAVFFCLLGNAAFSCAAGTLVHPSSPLSAFCAADLGIGEPVKRYYFLEDRYNLFLYAVVVPLYVALDVRMIKVLIQYWQQFRAEADEAQHVRKRSQLSHATERAKLDRRLATVFIGVCVLVGLFITQYVNDITRPASKIGPDYWFIRIAGGERVLNSVGAYYLMMNGVLLFLTITALWSYLSISAEVGRIARFLSRESLQAEPGRPAFYRSKLMIVFNQAFIYIKFLILIYAINILVWARSPLGDVSNAFVSLVALTAVALIVAPIPKLYLEYRVCVVQEAASRHHRDLLSTGEKMLSRAIDVAIVAILIFVAWDKFQIDYTHLWDGLLAPLKAFRDYVLGFLQK
jgi:hypothetical protein